jgi:hypothetical protein
MVSDGSLPFLFHNAGVVRRPWIPSTLPCDWALLCWSVAHLGSTGIYTNSRGPDFLPGNSRAPRPAPIFISGYQRTDGILSSPLPEHDQCSA